MSHFAQVVDGVVVQVIVAEQEFIDNHAEKVGEWIQTSYNTRGGIHYQPNTNTPSEDQTKALRKNYAGVGYTYSKDLDAFIPLKRFDSWVLNEETCTWNAPIPYPDDGKNYDWDEENLTWKLIEETTE